MSEQDLQNYFAYAAGVAAVLGVLNLFVSKSKPARIWLALACFALSGAAASYRLGLPIWISGVLGIGTVGLLVLHARKTSEVSSRSNQ
jgi:ABC-type Mn2+/Zn2+ transport system permease subunit